MNSEMQALLDHQQWVQKLARKLVNDPHVADDLAQETFLAALRSSGPPARSKRAWLGAVLRNLLWERMRSEDRRATREKSMASEDTAPSTVQLVERMSVHRNVVETVMELPEHYREVLLRRYFEGETPTEIAKRLDMPISTVKTRLQRGLERMRERLDERHGGDGVGWMLALVPLVKEGPLGEAAPAAASAAVTGGTWVAAAIVMLTSLGGVFAWRVMNTADAPTRLSQVALPQEISSPSDASEADGTIERESTSPATDPVDEQELLSALVAQRSTQAGSIFDVEGRVASGVVVMFEAGKVMPGQQATGVSIAVSDDEGRFTLEGVGGRGRIRAVGEDYVTVLSGARANKKESDEALLVVAPRLELSGRVIDDQGRGVSGAQLEILAPQDLRARFGEGLERSDACFFRCESDDEGRFDFQGAPRIPGATLVIVRDGYLDLRVEAPQASQPAMHLELATIGFEEGRITARVVDERGRAVPDARVSTGSEVVISDAEGLFHFDPKARDAFERVPTRLVAWKEGFGAGQYEREGTEAGASVEWPEDLELVLPDAPLAISGRVVDERGRPLKRVRVWLADATVFQNHSTPQEGSIESSTLLPDEPSQLVFPDVLESMIVGKDALHHVRTREDGSFRIEGLLDREYTLEVIDGASLSRALSRPTASGTDDLEIVLDLGDTRSEVRGRALSHLGEPVSGVQVRLTATAQEVRLHGTSLISQRLGSDRWVTGEDGAFLFRDVPRDGVYYRLEGPRILPRLYRLEPGAALPEKGLEIVVALRAQIHVQLPDPEEADAFELHDDEGRRLGLLSVQGSKRVELPRIDLHEGRSEVLLTASHGTTLVFFGKGVEVRRQSVLLRAGELNEIR